MAQAASNPAGAAAKTPPSSVAVLSAVAAVPHSSELWTVGYSEAKSVPRYFEARREHGRWTRVKAPKLGGSYAGINAVAASSSGSVWIGGNRQQAHSIQEYPAIWRWTGKTFAAQKMPALFAGGCDVTSISASSATNVWAAGSISPASNQSIEMLHFNGKKWSLVPYPETNDEPTVAVSTTSASNAFATDGTYLFHWNGTAWSTDGTAPADVQINDIAASSPSLAYAAGYNTTTGTRAILRFNGKTWSSVQFAKGTPRHVLLDAVTISGSAAWAIGEHNYSGGSKPVILHTSGGVWREQSSVASKFQLSDISAESSRSAYAVGYYDTAAGARTFFDLYNGHTWKGESSKL